MTILSTKSVLLFIIFLAIKMNITAQTIQASYKYDANGNRTSATIIYLSSSPSNSSPMVEEELKVDSETNLTIKIFPNPTEGDLRVEISGVSAEQTNNPTNAIRVYSMRGQLLFTLSPISSSNSVDFTRISKGTYIMQLFIGGKMKDYKIVKI